MEQPLEESPKPIINTEPVQPERKTKRSTTRTKPSTDTARKASYGMAVELYQEDSVLDASTQIDGTSIDQSFDYEAGFTALRFWTLRPLKEQLHYGIGFVYRGNYKGEDDYNFGLLNDIYGEFGGSLPIYKRWQIRAALRGGLNILIPTGDFGDEIKRQNAGGVGVFGGPRLGWFLGGTIGARAPLTERISFVTGLGLDLGRIYLFRTKKTVDNVNLQKTWTNQVKRYTFDLGVELQF